MYSPTGQTHRRKRKRRNWVVEMDVWSHTVGQNGNEIIRRTVKGEEIYNKVTEFQGKQVKLVRT